MRIFNRHTRKRELTDPSADVRLPLDDTPIQGISEQIDELINERFRKIIKAVQQLQEQTLIEPEAVAPFRAYDGQIEFADGVNWSPDGSGQPGLYYYWRGEWVPIGGNGESGRGYMFFVNPYSFGPYYQPGSVVQDDGWLMHCPDGSSERAAPQPIGLPETSPSNPSFATQSFNGVTWTGHQYTFTAAGWLQAVAVYVTQLTNDTNYRVLVGDVTDPDNQKWQAIDGAVLRENEWTSVALGAQPVNIGAVVAVIVDGLNSGPSTPYAGGWSRGGDENTAAPAAQSWNRRTQNDVMRISHTDLDGTDRQSELESFIPGATVQWVNTDNAAQSITYYVDTVTFQADHVEYGVSVTSTGSSGEPPVGATCTMAAEVPSPQPTEYAEQVGYWSGNQPGFADVIGVARLGGVDQSVPANAYGVRLEFQEAVVSSEWEFMAYSEL